MIELTAKQGHFSHFSNIVTALQAAANQVKMKKNSVLHSMMYLSHQVNLLRDLTRRLLQIIRQKIKRSIYGLSAACRLEL